MLDLVSSRSFAPHSHVASASSWAFSFHHLHYLHAFGHTWCSCLCTWLCRYCFLHGFCLWNLCRWSLGWGYLRCHYRFRWRTLWFWGSRWPGHPVPQRTKCPCWPAASAVVPLVLAVPWPSPAAQLTQTKGRFPTQQHPRSPHRTAIHLTLLYWSREAPSGGYRQAAQRRYRFSWLVSLALPWVSWAVSPSSTLLAPLPLPFFPEHLPFFPFEAFFPLEPIDPPLDPFPAFPEFVFVFPGPFPYVPFE